ncbi:protein disulfide oxidoreductase [Acidihalobacter prosperus]|uniref:Thioredoxin domain-containing protein n=1 Tax=Acidihalobacter prosperus TaxID=160660 RepID=A0A1A6C4Q9_9GAMM|nr:protein disulfide oxidoreductase [Acidihalobacter prosperus]OBS09530.1 hypothetical protein Thpro_021858 [Acidihalobacter prosperus]
MSAWLRRLRPGRRTWLRLGRDAAILLVVYAAVSLWQTRHLASGSAPALAAHAIDGSPVSLDALHGRPVLVMFWGTWCPICRTELSTLQALSRDWAVVTVAMDSGDAAKIRAFMRERHLDFTVIADPQGAMSRRWGVVAVPAGFVIGPAGQIRFRLVGLTSSWGLRARLWLARGGF